MMFKLMIVSMLILIVLQDFLISLKNGGINWLDVALMLALLIIGWKLALAQNEDAT